jgi:hypothetical protein
MNAALYIDPPSHHFLGDKLFEVDDGRPNGDRLLEPWAHTRRVLESRGIPVHTADQLPPEGQASDVVNVYVSAGMLSRYRMLAQRSDVVVSAFFVFECPIVEPSLYRALPAVELQFRRIYSWSDGPSLEHFVGSGLRCGHFSWPQSFDRVHPGIWDNRDRAFLAMINSNKLPRMCWRELYTERVRAVAFFEQYSEIDLYGPGWDQPSKRVGKTRLPYTLRVWQHDLQTRWQRIHPDPALAAARRAWRGLAPSKAETLGGYTFALCFENMILKGWITEKIFDCFFSGAVPIYWGAPEIAELIPSECFIDMRQFDGYADLRQFLKSLRPRAIEGYRAAAREFVQSAAFQPWSKDTFAERFLALVEEAVGMPLATVA